MKVTLESAFNSPQNAGIIPKAFFDDLAAEFDKLDFVSLMLPAYPQHISQDDAQAALDFYAAPAGKRFVDASPVLIEQSQKLLGAQGQQINLRLMNKYRDQIEANARAAAAKQQQQAPQ